MRPAHPFRHIPHTFRGPIGSSTEGPRGAVHMRLLCPVQRYVAPYGAPPQVPASQLALFAPRSGRPARVAGTPPGRPARVAGAPCCVPPSASLARRRSAQRQEPCPLSASQLTLFAPRSGRPARVAGTPPGATSARRGDSALRCARSLGFWSARAKRKEKKSRKRARSSQEACRHGRRDVRTLPSGFPRKLPAAATPSVTCVRTGMLDTYTRRFHDRIHANIFTRAQTHSYSDSLAL